MLTYPGLASQLTREYHHRTRARTSQRQRQRPGCRPARTPDPAGPIPGRPATAPVRRLRGRVWGLAGAVLVLAAAGCGSGSPGMPSVRLDTGPAAAALIDPVHVSIRGLPPSGLVTVQARALDRDGQSWVSAAVFRASPAGTLNLATAVPVSGSYHVADPAGLLWSLHPAPGTSQATGFETSPAGFTVRLQVLTGGRVRATATLRRRWQVTVSAQTVPRDGFDGLLYTSAAVRPGAPAVVVLGGSEGGFDAVPAAALAMSGYPALALAYFGEPGLPQCLCSIPLEYFARAVAWLRAQPAGRGRPVVLYGASAGAEAVLLLGSYLPHLADGVVASSPTAVISPSVGLTGAAWTLGGQPLTPGTDIPVARLRVPLLMGDGGQDPIWDAAAAASTIMAELRGPAGHAPAVNLYYPGAGHYYFGYPPYFPFFTNDDGLGGSVQANALATEQFWTRMITFLNRTSI